MTNNQALTVVNGGIGAGSAVPNFAAQKTIIVTGLLGTVNIEGSADGTNYRTIASFSTGGTGPKVVVAACAFMRVNATKGECTSVQVIAETSQIRSSALPAAALDAVGVALDITAFGPVCSIYCSNFTPGQRQDGTGGSVGIEISADGTNWAAFKTFQNSGVVTQNVAARYVRQVSQGAVADIAISGDDSPSGGGSSVVTSPPMAFVYNPTGTPGGNTYTDWATLVAAMEAVAGIKTLEFIGTAAITIPLVGMPVTGWNMAGVGWYARHFGAAASYVNVRIPEGVLLPGLRRFDGFIDVECTATATPPVADFATSLELIRIGECGGFPRIRVSGTAPLFDFGVVVGVTISIRNGYWGMAAVATSVGQSTSPGTVLFQGGNSQVGPDAIQGAAPTVTFQRGTGVGMWAVDQSSITTAGTLTHANPGTRSFNRVLPQGIAGAASVPSTAPIGSTQSGDLLLFNTTAGNIAQTLPNIVTSFTSQGVAMMILGNTITIKNAVGGNLVNVSPAGGQLIDGGAGPIAVPAGGSRTFESDGISNWYIVGGYL